MGIRGPAAGERPAICSVDELTREIRRVFDAEPQFKDAAVRGELMNFKRHSSGHIYFSLLGESAQISCVMWRSSAANIISWPADGDDVIVTGSVGLYPPKGIYQLIANRVLPVGLGAQARAREERRAALEREGMFDMRLKRPIPRFPRRVAVVTSPGGAAVRDILKVSRNRAPFIDIVILPAVVQGVGAPETIASALRLAGSVRGADCVILARGGGAKDDLQTFDDEAVVRAVRVCPLPVVTGIGHQIDVSLADLAADAAEPTPSAAAERVFPDAAEITPRVTELAVRLGSAVNGVIGGFSGKISYLGERLSRGIGLVVSAREEKLSRLDLSISAQITSITERADEALHSLSARLNSLSPLAVLSRGYAICSADGGKPVRSIGDVVSGDDIEIRVTDGKIYADVREKTPAQHYSNITSY